MLDALRERIGAPLRSGLSACLPGNLGLHLLFDGLVGITALTKGRFVEDEGRARTITRGSEGAYNYVFTGDGGGRWYCEVGDGTMRWHRGAHPSPRATVRVPVREIFKLLSGTTSFVTLEMTGKIATAGDAHATMMFGALIGQMRDLRKAPGRRGRLARAYLGLVLRRSGTGLTFADEE